jgi:hypothetical protein
MIRRLTLTIASVALFALAAAAPALAGAAPAGAPKQSRATTAERYGWILQLRNAVASKHHEDLSYKGFRAFARKNKRQQSWTDTADAANPVTYKGLPLYMLVGRIDDKDPLTFNSRLAKRGYSVVIEAVDGYTVTWTSQEIKGRKDLIVAERANGAPLPLGSLKEKDGVWSWKPTWPLKLVTGDAAVFGNRKPAAIERISIQPAAPAATGAAPF